MAKKLSVIMCSLVKRLGSVDYPTIQLEMFTVYH